MDDKYPIFRPDGSLYALYHEGPGNNMIVEFAIRGVNPKDDYNYKRIIIDNASFKTSIGFLNGNKFNIGTPDVDDYFDGPRFESSKTTDGRDMSLLMNVDGSVDTEIARKSVNTFNPDYGKMLNEGYELGMNTTTSEPTFLYKYLDNGNVDVALINPENPSVYTTEEYTTEEFNSLPARTYTTFDTGEVITNSKYTPLDKLFTTVLPDSTPEDFLNFLDNSVKFDTDVDYAATTKSKYPNAKSNKEREAAIASNDATKAMADKDSEINPQETQTSAYQKLQDDMAASIAARDKAQSELNAAGAADGSSRPFGFDSGGSESKASSSGSGDRSRAIPGDVVAGGIPIANIDKSLSAMEDRYAKELELQLAQQKVDALKNQNATANTPSNPPTTPPTPSSTETGTNTGSQATTPPAPSQTPLQGSTTTPVNNPNRTTNALGENIQLGKVVDSNGKELAKITSNENRTEFIIDQTNPDGSITRTRHKDLDGFVNNNPDVVIIGVDNKPVKMGKNVSASTPQPVQSLNTNGSVSSEVVPSPTPPQPAQPIIGVDGQPLQQNPVNTTGTTTTPTNTTTTTTNGTNPNVSGGANSVVDTPITPKQETAPNTGTTTTANANVSAETVTNPSVTPFTPLKLSKSSSKADILKFQKEWNANNPDNKLTEDGVYGPKTGKAVEVRNASAKKQYDESVNSTTNQQAIGVDGQPLTNPDGTPVITTSDAATNATSNVTTNTTGSTNTVPVAETTTAPNASTDYVPVDDYTKLIEDLKAGKPTGNVFLGDKYGDLTRGTFGNKSNTSNADRVSGNIKNMNQGLRDAINQGMVGDMTRDQAELNPKRGTPEGEREAEIASMARRKVENPALDFGDYLASAKEARMYEKFANQYYRQAKRDERRSARVDRKNEREMDKHIKKQDKDFYRQEMINRRVNDAFHKERPNFLEAAVHKAEGLVSPRGYKGKVSHKTNYPGQEQALLEREAALLEKEAEEKVVKAEKSAKLDALNHRISAERNDLATNPGKFPDTKAIKESPAEYFKFLEDAKASRDAGTAQALRNAETYGKEISAEDIVEEVKEEIKQEVKEEVKGDVIENKQYGGYTGIPEGNFTGYMPYNNADGTRGSYWSPFNLTGNVHGSYGQNLGFRPSVSSTGFDPSIYGQLDGYSFNFDKSANTNSSFTSPTPNYDPFTAAIHMGGQYDPTTGQFLYDMGTGKTHTASQTGQPNSQTAQPNSTSNDGNGEYYVDAEGNVVSLDDTIDPFSGGFKRRGLNIYGNRVQHYGDLIPTMFNLNKVIFDRPEVQSKFNNAHDFAYLQGLRNNMNQLNTNDNRGAFAGMAQYLSGNARGAGSRLSNMQAAYSNYASQLDKDALAVQNANIAQQNAYYDALKKTTDARRDEARRVDEANREHRATYEQYMIDSTMAAEKMLKNYGQMNNKEYEQYLNMAFLNAKNPNFKFKIDSRTGRPVIAVAAGMDKSRQHVVDPDHSKETQANIEERERVAGAARADWANDYTQNYLAERLRQERGKPVSQTGIHGNFVFPWMVNADYIGGPSKTKAQKEAEDKAKIEAENKAKIEAENKAKAAAATAPVEPVIKEEETESTDPDENTKKYGGYITSKKKNGGYMDYIINNSKNSSIFDNVFNKRRKTF